MKVTSYIILCTIINHPGEQDAAKKWIMWNYSVLAFMILATNFFPTWSLSTKLLIYTMILLLKKNVRAIPRYKHNFLWHQWHVNVHVRYKILAWSDFVWISKACLLQMPHWLKFHFLMNMPHCLMLKINLIINHTIGKFTSPCISYCLSLT